MTTEAFDIHKICNLSAEEFEVRRAQVNAQIFAHVQKREEQPTGLILHFEETPELRKRLDEFVAFERGCCSSIDWTVRTDSASLRLEIEGIDPKAEIFSIDRPAVATPFEVGSSRPWSRLGLVAVLVSTVAALLCVLPIGVAALVGTTSLLFLDNLWLAGAGAVVLGGLFWWWDAHRKTGRATKQAARGCGC